MFTKIKNMNNNKKSQKDIAWKQSTGKSYIELDIIKV